MNIKYISNQRELENQQDAHTLRTSQSPSENNLNKAKQCFNDQQFNQCKTFINKINPQTPKLLYESQTLLFKATYLQNPQNIQQLQKIMTTCKQNQSKPYKVKFKQYYQKSMDELMSIVKKSQQYAKNQSKINKKQLKLQMKKQQQKTLFAGFPCYLVSQPWFKKLDKYLDDDGPYPGAITNFELLNNLCEFEPHCQPQKQYMNKFIFNQNKFYIITKNYWQILQKIFSGYPIIRIINQDKQNKYFTKKDYLLKTQIKFKDAFYVMQWQLGTYWDKTVMPALSKKFGPGQLKYYANINQYHNVMFQNQVSPLKSQTQLIYVNVDTSQFLTSSKIQQNKKKQLFTKYDMQKYASISNRQLEIGLQNLGNTCYMNSGLQVLISIKDLSNYFLTNEYFTNININSTSNKDGSLGEVACAYADLVKKLWISPSSTNYINSSLFKKAFGARYQRFNQNQQQDGQQFLIFLLNCLHQDLNQYSQIKIDKKGLSSSRIFQDVKTDFITHYHKHNKSKISQLFNGFQFQQIQCDQCKKKSYKFNDYLMINLEVPTCSVQLILYFVQAKNTTKALKIQIQTQKLQKLKQLITIVSNKYQIPQDQLVTFLYYDTFEAQQKLTDQIQLDYIMKQLKQDPTNCLFIFQIHKPQSHQQIVKITYHYKNGQIGFPRFLAIPQSYHDQQSQNNKQCLKDILIKTIPQLNYFYQKKKYFKQIKLQKTQENDKYYTSNCSIYFTKSCDNLKQRDSQSPLKDTFNITQLLNNFNKQQIIDINEGWNCKQCKKARGAHKTDKIYDINKYLIFHFKRFTHRGKNSTKIEYPLINLNMNPYLYSPNKNNKPLNYNLFAVILHRGSLNGGHYTCIRKNKNRNVWLYCDDQKLYDIKQQNANDDNAYILFYEKNQNTQNQLTNGINTNNHTNNNNHRK